MMQNRVWLASAIKVVLLVIPEAAIVRYSLKIDFPKL